jgi:hypothetical protein
MLVGGALLSLTCPAPGLAKAPAEPPVCGTAPPGSHGTSAPAKATLALADQDPETVSGAAYGRRIGVRMMTLVYTVSGCRLSDTLPPPLDPPPIGPPKDDTVDTIPYGLIRLDGPPEIDGNQYIVHLKVATNPGPFTNTDGETARASFAPGSYAGFLHLRSPWLRRVGTPVSISRSDDQWVKVALLAALGALAGFLTFVVLHWFARAELMVGRTRFAVAGLISVIVGGGVAYTTNYLNQTVWTMGANGRALMVAAFTAATTGPMVTGLLGKVYDDNKVVTDAVKNAKQVAAGHARDAASAKAEAVVAAKAGS